MSTVRPSTTTTKPTVTFSEVRNSGSVTNER